MLTRSLLAVLALLTVCAHFQLQCEGKIKTIKAMSCARIKNLGPRMKYWMRKFNPAYRQAINSGLCRRAVRNNEDYELDRKANLLSVSHRNSQLRHMYTKV